MRHRLRTVLALAVIPAVTVTVWATPATAKPKEPPRPVHIVRTVVVEVPATTAPESWQGRITFGLVTTGVEGRLITRPAPLELTLSRTTCDLAGCVQTVLSLPDDPVPAASRMAAGLSSASLGPALVGVRVRRVIDGVVVSDHPASIAIQVTARRAGTVAHEVRAWTDGSVAYTSIVQAATARTTLRLGDDLIPGTRGQLSKVRTVTQASR